MKGNKMKKTLLVLGLLSLFMASAQAGYWKHTTDVNGNVISKYVPEYKYLGNNRWGWE